MARRKETELEKIAMDFARAMLKAREDGKSLDLAELLEEVINVFIKAERELYLKNDPDNQANGFYDRKLNLTLGKLNIKVPRIRYGNTLYPALLYRGILVLKDGEE